ncbi:MAG: ferrous iron transporter B, partial [Candidatus Caldatribacterium sp.]|nr:ferrous iron transporter B [Candidatus Caldatribacterium sp.]
DGHIDFERSLGLLSTGVYVSLGAVLPYVFAFYFVLGILEDVGYLPRLAVFLDGFLHRLGLHGYSVVPMLLGLGCNVPGIMATRILESEKERFVVTLLIAIGIPCSAQQALIVGVLAPYGVAPVLTVYGTLLVVVVLLAFLLKYLVPGFRPPLICEIPPYRLPFPKAVLSKLWVRLRGFLRDALPVVFLGVLAVNLLSLTNAFPYLAKVISPWFAKVLGLPQEALFVIALGFLRKYMAMGLLLPLGLSVKQLVIASVILSLFFPCVAAFVVILREFGWKRLLVAVAIMLSFAFLVGSFLNLLL